MKRILFFVRGEVGGAERMSVTIGKMLDKQKYKIIFCLYTSSIHDTPIRNFIPDDYEVHIINKMPILGYLGNMYREIYRVKPNIIFSSLIYINIRLLMISFFFPKCKFIIRNDNYLYTYPRWKRILLKYTYRSANQIIVQTDEMKSELIQLTKLNKEIIHTLANPLDLETINNKIKDKNPFPSNDKKIKFVAAGRFHPVKGFDILVEAFHIIKQKHPNTELYILGRIDGEGSSYYQIIKEKIINLGLENDVHCIGFQPNPYKYIIHADCFVLSSRNEGLPNVLIESQYLGTPAAATDCIPVVKRIIKEGCNGYIAQTENPASLADAMIKAAKLGRIKQTYQACNKNDILSLFANT